MIFFRCRIILFMLLLSPHGLESAEVKLAFDESYLELAPRIYEEFQEAYQRIDVELSIHILPGRRAIAMANGGEYQALDARFLGNDSLTNMVPVMEPIYSDFKTYAWGLPSTELFIGQLTDLSTYSVVAVRANTFNLSLKRQWPKFYLVEDEATAVKMIETLRADLALISDVGLLRLQGMGIGQQLQKKSGVLHQEYLYHHVHQSHQHLVPKLEKVIQSMKREGKFSER